MDTDFLSASTKAEGKYLTFFLGREKFGFSIVKIQEILGVSVITPIPNSPNYLRGVINLRGKIVPVLDLRGKFRMPARTYDDRTCFVVINTTISEQNISVAMVVDTVVEVLQFDDAMIDSAPEFGRGEHAQFIQAIGKSGEDGDEAVTLLDVEKIVCSDRAILVPTP